MDSDLDRCITRMACHSQVTVNQTDFDDGLGAAEEFEFFNVTGTTLGASAGDTAGTNLKVSRKIRRVPLDLRFGT